MRGSLFFAATLAFASLIASSSGCSSETGASGDRICTPGANVFCRCADREPGTKECSADGTSFAPCTTGVPGECKGEIQDPDTGKPVDDGGNPILNDGGTTNIADKCPGKAFAVEPTKPTAISGDTTAATDAAKGQGSCAVGDQAKDEIYKLTPSGSGTLTVEVQGKNGFSPNVYLRTVCDDEASQAACNPQGSAQGLVKLTRRVTKGTPIYLVVDGKLSRREVKVVWRDRDSVIARGLKSGEAVLVTPLAAPTEGLEVIVDEEVEPLREGEGDGGTREVTSIAGKG